MSVSAPHPTASNGPQSLSRPQTTTTTIPSKHRAVPQRDQAPGGGSAPAWGMLGVVDESDYSFLILGIPTWKMAVYCHGEFPSFVIGAKT